MAEMERQTLFREHLLLMPAEEGEAAAEEGEQAEQAGQAEAETDTPPMTEQAARPIPEAEEGEGEPQEAAELAEAVLLLFLFHQMVLLG